MLVNEYYLENEVKSVNNEWTNMGPAKDLCVTRLHGKVGCKLQ